MPFIGILRYPIKFVVLVLALVPLLAAFGYAGVMAKTGALGRFEWGALVRVTRYGAVYDQSYDSNAPVMDGASAQRFGANWSADLEISYHFMPTVSVAFGGNNVFDRYPDRTYAGSTLGGALPYDYIAPIGMNGAFYYGRLAVTF